MKEHYSEQEVKMILDLKEQGLSVEDIQKELVAKLGRQRPISSIKYFMRKKGNALEQVKRKVIGKSGRFEVKVKCTKCLRTYNIPTANPELYTDEVIKNYKCLVCRG